MPQLALPTPTNHPAMESRTVATNMLWSTFHATNTTVSPDGHASGETTPDFPKTVSSVNDAHRLKRTDSQETLLTVISGQSELTVMSETSRIYPPVPANTPLARSVAGDPLDMRLRIASLTAHLKKAIPPLTHVTPPDSIIDEGEGAAEGAVNASVVAMEMEASLTTRHIAAEPFTTPTTIKAASNGVTTNRDADSEPKSPPPATSKIFPEHTTWADMAEEDVTKGLLRLFRVARDEHQLDPSQTVEHYYSLRLAKLLKGGDIRFDPTYLC